MVSAFAKIFQHFLEFATDLLSKPKIYNKRNGIAMTLPYPVENTTEAVLVEIIENVRKAYDQLPRGDAASQELELAIQKYDKFVSHKLAIHQLDTR